MSSVDVDIDQLLREMAAALQTLLRDRGPDATMVGIHTGGVWVAHGSGAAEGSRPVTCETCHGRGEVQHVQRSFLGEIRTLAVHPDRRGERIGALVLDHIIATARELGL